MLFIAGLLVTAAQSAEPGREVKAEEILAKIQAGEPVEYDNVTIVGDLDISGLDLPKVPAQRTEIEKHFGVPNYEVLVASPINITNSTIRGSVNLNVTSLQAQVIFYDTEFEGPAYFIRSRFNQTATFRSAKFNQISGFWRARFNQTANFGGARFKQIAGFDEARFNQTATFRSARFNQVAGFPGVRFNQTADFSGAQFNQIAGFPGAQFNWTADFRWAQFNQNSHFEDAHFLDASFDNSQFSQEAFFDGVRISDTLSLYRTKYDKLNIRWSAIHDLAYDETAYYLLIENFKKLGFTDDAKECYYSYRCKHGPELLRQGKPLNWLFDTLAWWTYGYGLRPERPLGWSLFFILAAGIFFWRSKGFKRSEGQSDVSLPEAVLLSAAYFSSGASDIISSTSEEFRPVGKSRYLIVFLRLSGWIFFILFLVTLGQTIGGGW